MRDVLFFALACHHEGSPLKCVHVSVWVCVLLWVLLLSYQFKTKQKYTTKNGLYTLHWGERVYNTLFGRFVCSVVRCWWCFTLSFSSKTLNNSINNNEFANPPKNRNDFQTYWIWTASEKKKWRAQHERWFQIVNNAHRWFIHIHLHMNMNMNINMNICICVTIDSMTQLPFWRMWIQLKIVNALSYS